MGKIVAVISGKGGTGKTTISANLGAALSLMDQKVLLIDGDAGLRNLDLLLGLETKIKVDLDQVLKAQSPWQEAVLKVERFPNLYLIPGAKEHSVLPVFESVELFRTVKEEFDWVLIDCPAGMGDLFRVAVNQAEQLICVVTPDITSVQNGRRALREALQHSKAEPLFILNRANFNAMVLGESLDVESVAGLLPAILLGVIEEDSGFVRAANLGELLMVQDRSPATQSLRRIAKRLLGEKIAFPKMQARPVEEVGFLKWWRNLIK